MKKKVVIGVLGTVVLAVVVACAVYVVRVPDLTIYFDSGKGDAFTMQTKTGVTKKIKLHGYDKVSFATPFDSGYYCHAEKGGKDYFLMVQNGQVTGELVEPEYGDEQIVNEMCATDDGLYISCSAETGTVQKIIFADFTTKQVTELPFENVEWKVSLSACGDTLLVGWGSGETLQLYRYQKGQLIELVQGNKPVLLNETHFLYQAKDNSLMLYDLTTGESQTATQKVNFDLYTAGMDWSAAPTAANGWLVGWRGGIPTYEATALVSGITVTNVDSGESYWLPTTLGRTASNLQAISNT